MQKSVIKKTVLMLLLLTTGSAWAEWVKVDEAIEGDKYIDPATIRKDGDIRRVWEILDLKKRNKYGQSSIRTRVEYDCKQERYNILSLTTHSKSMAQGSIIDNGNFVPNWVDIPPGSVSSNLIKIICSR